MVDTAGRVKKGKLALYDDMGGEVAERANKEAEKAVHFSHVVVLLLDVSACLNREEAVHHSSSLTHFEGTMAEKALNHGRPLIILANKMDLVGKTREEKERVNQFLTHAVPNYQGVTCIPISAKTGLGINFLLPAVAEAYDKWCRRIQTSHLNEWLSDLKHFHSGGGPTSVLNRIRYATQVKVRPPTFAFFLSGTKKRNAVPSSVEKYLANSIQKSFGLQGIPVRIHFR